MDEIKNADLPSAKLAEYGVNQSMSCRSGMIFIPQLNDAASKLQKPNPYYYNGEFGEMIFWDFYTMVRKDFDNVMPVDPPRTAFEDLENEDLSTAWAGKKDGASRIAQLLFEEATDIRFIVGRAINPAHQNPDLPISIVIKMGLIDELAEILRKMGKQVTVSYY